MKFIAALFVILAGTTTVQAQLTTQQKLADFQSIADQFAKRYVAIQWKKQLFGVDAFNIKPFLDRAAATTNDLDFYEVCVDYIAQFHDGGHVFFELPSDFLADTGIRVDTYDNGKPLIYAVNRTYLPVKNYPFQVGDEIVSIDGRTAQDLMASLAKYGNPSNPRTEAAFAALYLTVRPQIVIPGAVNVPDSSQIAIKRQTTGAVETYTVKWVKTGEPLLFDGPVTYPQSTKKPLRKPGLHIADTPAAGSTPTGLPLNYSRLSPERGAALNVSGIGATRPVFTLPSDFKVRLGRSSADAFYSGTYQSNGYTIGFLRIPSFDPLAGTDAALAQLETEVTYFNANTDGLVIDDMRNPGGLVFYGEDVARRLIPVPFHLVGFELRATTDWVRDFSFNVTFLKSVGAPQYFIDDEQFYLDIVKRAYSENGGHTGPLPLDTLSLTPTPIDPSLDTTPALNSAGKPVGYTKPMIVLTDEFSFSGADYFPAVMQDNQAATIYGMRTSGLGGTNAAYDGGAFSESTVGMLRGLMYRKNPVTVPGYPTTNYIENVGVHPDIVDDYKTLDNLLNGGKTFVSNFTAAMVKKIQSSKQ